MAEDCRLGTTVHVSSKRLAGFLAGFLPDVLAGFLAECETCLVKVDTGEQQVCWNGVWCAMQQVSHLPQGHRAVPCQMVALC